MDVEKKHHHTSTSNSNPNTNRYDNESNNNNNNIISDIYGKKIKNSSSCWNNSDVKTNDANDANHDNDYKMASMLDCLHSYINSQLK